MPEDKNLQILLCKSIYNKDLVIAKCGAFGQKICIPIRTVGTHSEKSLRFPQSPQRHTSRHDTHKGQGEKKKNLAMQVLPRNA